MEPTEEDLNNIFCFWVSSKEDFDCKVRNFLTQDIKGLEIPGIEIATSNIQLKPSFMVDYSINADFSTSVGLIHSVHKASHILLDEKGEYAGDSINNALLSLNEELRRADEIEKSVEVTHRDLFTKTNTEIREIAKQLLIYRYSKTVGYYGRNNVHYYKTCTIKPKNLQFSKIKKVYTPIWHVIFSLYGSKYCFDSIENSSGLTLLLHYQQPNGSSVKKYPHSCMICGSTFGGEGKFVCHECGKLSCIKDTFVCKKCGKPICLEHTIFKRRLLVLKEKYCTKCYDSLFSGNCQ